MWQIKAFPSEAIFVSEMTSRRLKDLVTLYTKAHILFFTPRDVFAFFLCLGLTCNGITCITQHEQNRTLCPTLTHKNHTIILSHSTENSKNKKNRWKSYKKLLHPEASRHRSKKYSGTFHQLTKIYKAFKKIFKILDLE